MGPENSWRTWAGTWGASVQKLAFLTISSPPPRAANEQSGMNGFQLLCAGDWVMVVILNGPLRPRCVCSSVKPWLGSWLGSVWLKSNSCKVILQLFSSETTWSVKFVKGLTFELRMVVRISSGASTPRKSQASPAGISFGLQRAYLLLLILGGIIGWLNLIKLDIRGWGWNCGPVLVTIIPPFTAKLSAWTPNQS